MSTVLTVSQINTFIKSLLDGDGRLSDLYVCGEISNFSPNYRSGHLYFTLKDEKSALKAVMFAFAARRLRFTPQNGMRVLVRGRVSVYEAGGQYQLYAEEMQPDGMGSLMLAFEQLKEKLQKEGLFAVDRKKPLPKYPNTIGIITSPTGAAVQDMMEITKRRWPLAELLLYPVTVQGPTAPPQIVQALAYYNEGRCCDAIILGRGGGSAEDLWCFNDEQVVRAVAQSRIPVISAVGHETDFTLCDFAADVRADTPSDAAVRATPDREEEAEALDTLQYRLQSAMEEKIGGSRHTLDLLGSRMENCMHKGLFGQSRELLLQSTHRMQNAIERRLQTEKAMLRAQSAKLDALSPLKVLARGYAVVFAENSAVTDANSLQIGQQVQVRFAKGDAQCRVEEIHKEETAE